MSQSSTVIIAIKFDGGVVIAADSQASDMTSMVRWRIGKVHQINNFPLIVGFSGSVGSSDRMREALEQNRFHNNMFKRRGRIRNAIEQCLKPEFQRISENPDVLKHPMWKITVNGLVVYWSENSPHIVEIEPNGDLCFHEHFHAIGSGTQTAYAIWRTLGGRELVNLQEPKSLQVALRIMKTCIGVEVYGVAEPFDVWVLSEKSCQRMPDEALQTISQYVSQWEEQERSVFLNQSA